jgi:hypothetical protein
MPCTLLLLLLVLLPSLLLMFCEGRGQRQMSARPARQADRKLSAELPRPTNITSTINRTTSAALEE